MTEPVFACRGLSVRFEEPPVRALDGIDFRLESGELVAVLGATGAGKSTLLKSINRIVPELERASIEGDLTVFGRSVEGLRVADFAGAIAFVFQDFEAQLFSTSVREEILFGLEQLAVDPSAMDARVAWALEAVGLSGFERREPIALSGGEKQRLAIAAMLALDPRLLLLDEPSTDLDPAGRRGIFDVLRRLRKSGAALMIAEHDVDSVRDADRVVVLSAGKIALCGPAEHVLDSPERLDALGVRPPELASVCAALRVPAWPLDVDSVEARLRGAGIRFEARQPAADALAGECQIEAHGVHFRFPDAAREALRGVSLRLHAGEIVAIVGSNGSGKSTLARHLNGLLVPDRGRVLWRGRALSSLSAPERAAAVGYVFQDPDEQIFAASVEDEVAFGPKQIGCAESEVRRRVDEALAAVGGSGLAARDPFLLAKSERQRVAVASVLALSPSILILDEPTTGLDYRQTLELFAVLRNLNRDGRTIVVITHVPWVVAAYARRVILMSEGEVLWDGGVRELLEHEELCRRGDFIPGEVTRLGRRFGVTPLSVEECLSWARV